MQKNGFLTLTLFAGSLVVCLLMIRIGFHKKSLAEFSEKLGKPIDFEFKPLTLAPEQIISGKPTFSVMEYSRSLDGKAINGLWECIGPTEFVWHYAMDESVYIIEGDAEVTYRGRKFILKPNQGAYFLAGTSAVWVVKDRVKKAWSHYEPGRISRFLRKLAS